MSRGNCGFPRKSLFRKRFRQIHRRCGRVHHRGHIDLNSRVQSEHLRDAWHFVCRKHDAEAEQDIIFPCHKTEKQQGGLHEGGQAECDHLFAPLREAVRIAARQREQIQAPDRDLRQQDSPALDVGEKDLDDAVAEGNQKQQFQQPEAIQGIYTVWRVPIQHLPREFQHISACRADEVTGKCVLQGDGEAVKLDRQTGKERRGKEAFQDIQKRCFNVRPPAALVLNGEIENRDCDADRVQSPSEQAEKFQRRLDPGQVEQLRPHAGHLGKKFCDSTEHRAVQPCEVFPIDDLPCAAECRGQPADPIQHPLSSHSEYLPQIQRAGQAEDQTGEENGGWDIVELSVLAVIEVRGCNLDKEQDC